MKATIVFEQIWEAMQRKEPDGSNTYKYIILKGSSRSSKTYSLMQAFYLYAWQNNGKRLSVWRNTKKDCKDMILHDMKKVYASLHNYNRVLFNKTESYFSFPTNSNIEIQGTDDEEKVHGYQGSCIWLNEPYKISRDTFDQLDMRADDFIFIDWNPKKSHWIEDVSKDKRSIVLHNTFKDNPFCPPNQKVKILSYQPVKRCEAVEIGLLTEQEAHEYEFGSGGLTPRQEKELARCIENERKGSADNFKWDVYGLGEKGEKPNRIFNWTEIPAHEYEALDATEYGGVDWGTVDPWGVLNAKYYDGTLYLDEKNYLSENEIRAKMDSVFLAGLQRGPDGKEEEGLLKHIFDRFGVQKNSIILCDTNRPMKIKALRDIGYDNAVAAPKPKGSINDGIDLLNNIRVCFTDRSKNIKYEQENYSWKEDRYGVRLEEPEDEDNHLMDATRYIALYLYLNGIIRI